MKKTGLEKSSDLSGKQLVHVGAGGQPRVVRPAAGTPNRSTVCVQESEFGPDPTLCARSVSILWKRLSARDGDWAEVHAQAPGAVCVC